MKRFLVIVAHIVVAATLGFSAAVFLSLCTGCVTEVCPAPAQSELTIHLGDLYIIDRTRTPAVVEKESYVTTTEVDGDLVSLDLWGECTVDVVPVGDSMSLMHDFVVADCGGGTMHGTIRQDLDRLYVHTFSYTDDGSIVFHNFIGR